MTKKQIRDKVKPLLPDESNSSLNIYVDIIGKFLKENKSAIYKDHWSQIKKGVF
jgi:hypothetical protein